MSSIGGTELINSIIRGDLKTVKYLVKKGINIHVFDDYGLKAAIKNNHLDIVKYLVEKGVDIHADNDNALQNASYYGHLEIVKYLLEKGANIHANNDGALRFASGNGHKAVVEFLVKNGANIHAFNDGALVWASENGHSDIVKYLVENGADWRLAPSHQIKDIILKENNQLVTDLTKDYLTIKKTIPLMSFKEEGEKSQLNDKIIRKTAYQTEYHNLCNNINSEVPPIKLIKLANLLNTKYVKKEDWSTICDKVKISIENYIGNL